MKNISALLTAAATVLVLAACSSETETAVPAATTAASPAPAASATAPSADGQSTPITLTVEGRMITATLNDSAVSRDFAATLPATLPWSRNGSIEYITELAAPMTETGPFYTDVQAGDLVYYNPRDSLTIIYAPTSSVPTLTKMGEITSDLSVFEGLPDDINITVARA